MIMMRMSDKDLTDPDCLLIIHESWEVFEEQLVLLGVVPWLNHHTILSGAHNETVRPAQGELTRVVPWDVVDEVT